MTAISSDRSVSAQLIEALNWYAEQMRLCRLIHTEGDAGRQALAADGGAKARAALAAAEAQPVVVGAALKRAAEATRYDLGADGTNYPAIRKLLEFAEQAIAAPVAQSVAVPECCGVPDVCSGEHKCQRRLDWALGIKTAHANMAQKTALQPVAVPRGEPTNEQLIAAIKAAHFHVTDQSLKDMRAALLAAFAAAPAAPAVQPIGRAMTNEELMRSDGKMGRFVWWTQVDPGAFLYAGAVAPAVQHQEPTEPDLRTKLGDLLCIGVQARTDEVILANVANAARRSDCLRGVESTFFMVETPPNEDDDGVPGQECLLNWGQDRDEYVAQFGEALKQIHGAPQDASKTPAAQPLTREQVERLRLAICDRYILGMLAAEELARAVEAAHGITGPAASAVQQARGDGE